MGYFQVRYDSRVVIYDRRGFIRLATGVVPIRCAPLKQIRNLKICSALWSRRRRYFARIFTAKKVSTHQFFRQLTIANLSVPINLFWPDSKADTRFALTGIRLRRNVLFARGRLLSCRSAWAPATTTCLPWTSSVSSTPIFDAKITKHLDTTTENFPVSRLAISRSRKCLTFLKRLKHTLRQISLSSIPINQNYVSIKTNKGKISL